MNKPQIIVPNRPQPYLVDAYNGYYGNLNEFYMITIRFWKSSSYMYDDAALLCTAFPEHITATANNGFVNEFRVRNIEECYEYSDVLRQMEFYTRNWKYCEYYIGTEPVYHNELWCYIHNLIKNTAFPNIKIINPEKELKYRRGKWVNEKLLFNTIASLYPDYTVLYHYRAKWLENLELDIYIEELRIGIEYQGIQHYEIVKHWGGVDGLEKRKNNDMKKKRLCEKNGVILVYFKYTESLTNTYVKNKMSSIIKRK